MVLLRAYIMLCVARRFIVPLFALYCGYLAYRADTVEDPLLGSTKAAMFTIFTILPPGIGVTALFGGMLDVIGKQETTKSRFVGSGVCRPRLIVGMWL